MTVGTEQRRWTDALDVVAAELLDTARVEAPPVDPLEIARRMNVEVAIDRSQGGRGRFKRIGGQPAILLRPEERPERVFWAAAHELGEMLFWRITHVRGAGEDEILPTQREELANRFASRLLIPAAWFAADACRLDGDLMQLKARYATASHELIALRMLDLDQPTVIAVFDHGKPTRRRSNVAGGTPPIQAVERRARGDAHLLGVPVDLTRGALRTQAWPIHEPGWKREILRTTLRHDEEGEIGMHADSE